MHGDYYVDPGSRRTTVWVFLALTGFVVLAARMVPMPSRDRVERSLEILMLESVEIAAAAEEERDEEAPEPVREAEPEDLTELMSAFAELSFSELSPDEAAPQLREETFASLGDLELDTDDLLEEFGSARPLDLDLDEQRDPSAWTLSPGLLSAGRFESEDLDLGAAPDLEENFAAERQATPDNLFESIRSDESGFVLYADSIILPSDQIAEWIRPRQSEADPGVRALVRADSSMLMAKDFLAQHAVEVQLVYAPASRKLHVVLVEGDSLYYFIDPGSRQEANYFRRGRVRRGEASEVVMVESEELPVNSPQARRFFDLFLSWWTQQQ